VFVAKLAETSQKFFARQNTSHIAGDRLHNDARHFVFVRVEKFFYACEIVVICNQRVLGKVFRHTGGVWLAERHRPASSPHQKVIGVTVIAAVKFYNVVALCETARRTNCAHHSFGPAAGKTDEFDRWKNFADEFCKLRFAFGRSTKTSSRFCGFANCVHHFLAGMAKKCRSPRADVVDIFFSVGVEDVRATCTIDKNRFAADMLKRAHRRIYATNQIARSIGKKCV